MISMRVLAALVASMSLLAACGGGGGGGGNNSPPPPSPGSFTLSANAASFSSISGLPTPAEKTFDLTVTGSKVAAVGAGYANGQPSVGWLAINITGSGNNFFLHVGINPGFATLGTNTASFTVGTGDAAGNILKTQVFTVTYVVDPHLEATGSSSEFNFQFGDSVRVATLPVTVTAPNRQWKFTSDTPWLGFPAATQTGTGAVDVTIDVTGLAPGVVYYGAFRVVNSAEPLDYRDIPVNVYLAPAHLTVSENNVAFGGDTGTAPLDSVPVNFTLDTGSGVHPFTASVTTDSGGNWLTLDKTSGTVGAAGAAVNLDVDTAQLAGGTYTGELTISTEVYGTVFTEHRPVTLNLEANRIVVTASGVALSSVAGRDVLTRTLKVVSALGRTDTPWSAVSDQPWLSVTSSGVTSGNLVLAATPGALGKDVTHFANVTITSSDPKVENSQTVRVGLFLSDTAPVKVDFSGFMTRGMAASPVEPLIAIAANPAPGMSAGGVGLYDVYSGALVRPVTAVLTQPATMKFSEDGRTLFVYDWTPKTVVEVDVATGAYVRTYDATPNGIALEGTALAVMHPNGYPMLVTPNGRAYDLETRTEPPHLEFGGNRFILASNTDSYAVSPDQSLLVPHFGTPSRVIRTALDGGGLRATFPGVNTPIGSDNGDACVSGSGARLYSTNVQGGSILAGVDIASEQIDQELPAHDFVVALQCVWNGLVVAGEAAYYSDHDIQVFDGATGNELAPLSSDGDDYFNYRWFRTHQLVVSGDGTRVMSAWQSAAKFYTDGIYIQDLPTPP